MAYRHRSLTIFLVIALALLCFASAKAQGPGQSAEPAWIKNTNVADYVLLPKDLRPPYTQTGEINAEAQAQSVGIKTDKGIQSSKSGYIRVWEGILLPDKPSKIPGYPNPSAGMLVQIFIFETPEDAIASMKETGWFDGTDIMSGPADNRLGDPRLNGGVGCSSAHGRIVRYRNAIFWQSVHGATEEEKDFPGLARLWIDKV